MLARTSSDQPPNVIAQPAKLGGKFDAEVARPRQIDLDLFLQPPPAA